MRLRHRDRDSVPGLPGTRRGRADHQIGSQTLVRQPGTGRVGVSLNVDLLVTESDGIADSRPDHGDAKNWATQVGERLWAQQVVAQEEMERHWSAVRDWLGDMLVERGVDRISAEELTVPPGLDELFSLLQIKRHHEEGRFDCVIVDCAPTGETLRLLSFPDVARWWLEKIFPQQNQIMAAARPELAWLRLSIGKDGTVQELSYEDASGNRTEFRFEGWRREKSRPPGDFRISGPPGYEIVYWLVSPVERLSRRPCASVKQANQNG